MWKEKEEEKERLGGQMRKEVKGVEDDQEY